MTRQIAELRLCLLLGEAASAGRLVQIRADLGIRRDIGALAEVAARTGSGQELAACLRKLMGRPPDAVQQALLADLAARWERLFAAAAAAL